MFLMGTTVYNDKGQLETIKYPGYEVKMDFLWKDDNMVQLNIEDEQIDFTYTGLENKNNFGFLLRIDEFHFRLVFPFYSLLGKPTKHLPESIEQEGRGSTYQYKLDEEGFIDEMTIIYPDGVAGGKEVRYKFVYE